MLVFVPHHARSKAGAEVNAQPACLPERRLRRTRRSPAGIAAHASAINAPHRFQENAMNRIRTALLTGAAFALVAAVSPSYADSNRYDAKVLVADIPPAPHLDPHLVNGWGVAFNRNPNGFVWVSDNGTGVATLYDGLGNPQSLVVTIPAVPGSDHGTPTGIVFNTSAFAVSSAGKTGSSAFIFATEDGLIAGWSPGVDV